MRNDNLDFITVNGRRYAIDLLNPLDAITWGSRVMTLIGPVFSVVVDSSDLRKLVVGLFTGKKELGDGQDLEETVETLAPALSSAFAACGKIETAALNKIFTQAIRQCYTPKNEPLSNMDVFNRHFREYPKDLFMLGVMASYRLVRDFFPSLSGTGRSPSREPDQAEDWT